MQPFNVLRYKLGQHYDSHYDIFEPESYGPQSSQRVGSLTKALLFGCIEWPEDLLLGPCTPILCFNGCHLATMLVQAKAVRNKTLHRRWQRYFFTCRMLRRVGRLSFPWRGAMDRSG